jgi:ParB-like chromosome segregation protein Spo0J
MICGGHGRKKILERLGIKEVDCYIPSRKLTQKEFDELNIRLNKNIAGEWDFDILANDFELPDLIEWGFEEGELGMFEPATEEEQGKLDEKKKVKCPECGAEF